MALDRHTLDAQVSAVITALPFPPMPTIALAGHDCDDALASSHDLFASMIAVNMERTHNDPLSDADHARIACAKQKVLLGLASDLQNLAAGKEFPRADEIYSLMQSRFREYASLYPGHPDLRFADISTIDKNSTIHRQACAHLTAFEANFEERVPDCLPHHRNTLPYPALLVELASTLLEVYMNLD